MRKPRENAPKTEDQAANERAIEGYWRAARVLAMKAAYPYSPAISSLIPQFDYSIITKHKDENGNIVDWPTMATDKYFRVYIHPDAVTKWMNEARAISPSNPCENCGATSHFELAYVAGVICHETMHPLEKHSKRGQEINAYASLFNKATDCEINDGLLELFECVHQDNQRNGQSHIPRLCLPKGVCHPKKMKRLDGSLFNFPEHKFAEFYYFEMLDHLEKEDKGGSKDGEAMEHGCGSGAHGHAEVWDKGSPGESNVEGVSEAEADFVAREVAKSIKEAAARGTMPGSMVAWADGVLAPPAYDWRKEYKKCLRGSINTNHGFDLPTYRKFARDCAAADYDVIRPASYTPKPRVAVVVDSSGSMGGMAPGSPLHFAISEAEGICKSMGVAMEILVVDCAADDKQIQEVSSAKRIRLDGGGGTDMRVGIELFQKRRKNRPDILVVLTDGDTPWPETKPKEFRMVVGIVGDHPSSWARQNAPKYCKVLYLNDKG